MSKTQLSETGKFSFSRRNPKKESKTYTPKRHMMKINCMRAVEENFGRNASSRNLESQR